MDKVRTLQFGFQVLYKKVLRALFVFFQRYKKGLKIKSIFDGKDVSHFRRMKDENYFLLKVIFLVKYWENGNHHFKCSNSDASGFSYFFY